MPSGPGPVACALFGTEGAKPEVAGARESASGFVPDTISLVALAALARASEPSPCCALLNQRPPAPNMTASSPIAHLWAAGPVACWAADLPFPFAIADLLILVPDYLITDYR